MNNDVIYDAFSGINEEYLSVADNTDAIRHSFKKNRAKKTKIIGSVVCCAVLVIAAGWISSQNWFGKTPSVMPNETTNAGSHLTTPTQTDNTETQPGSTPTANNKIVINTISGIPSNEMRMNLAVEDFVEMSREEMTEYYGTDCFPDVPADLKVWEGERLGIFKRNGGTGEVYWDQVVLNYSNQDITRHINIEVAKGNIPFLDYSTFSVEDDTSVINNVELKIGLTDDGHYYTEFMYKNVGFIISADGLSQDEFVSVIASIIK